MATQQEHIVAELTAVDKTQAAFNSIQSNIRKTTKQSKAFNGQMRLMRGGLGQVGHQIQDVAVQLQMGTNAMIVFGQQGSQIASLFGPKGAILGAVLAVGAAIAVGLSRDVETGVDALKKLKDEGLDLAFELGGNLTPAMLEFNRAVKESDRLKLEQSLIDDAAASEDLARDLRLARMQLQMLSSLPGIDPNTSKEFKQASDLVRELTLQEATLAARQDITRGKLKLLSQGYKRSTESRLASAQRIIDSANRELDAMVSKAEKEKKLEDDAQRSADKRNQLRIRATQASIAFGNLELNQFIANQKARQEAVDEAIEADRTAADRRLFFAQMKIDATNRELDAFVKAEKEKQAAQRQTLSNNSMVISNMQQITGAIMQNMDKQSSSYKAMFALQQALAIAQTIVQYEVAIAMTKGQLGIFGLPMEGLLRAQQVAAVALIAGQTIAGFEGGGYTGSGVRSGGMDGKGGRLAMVHPNEKITDLHKGQGDTQAVNVSFNIQANDARGFDELLVQRRGLITSMVRQALNNSGKRLA